MQGGWGLNFTASVHHVLIILPPVWRVIMAPTNTTGEGCYWVLWHQYWGYHCLHWHQCWGLLLCPLTHNWRVITALTDTKMGGGGLLHPPMPLLLLDSLTLMLGDSSTATNAGAIEHFIVIRCKKCNRTDIYTMHENVLLLCSPLEVSEAVPWGHLKFSSWPVLVYTLVVDAAYRIRTLEKN